MPASPNALLTAALLAATSLAACAGPRTAAPAPARGADPAATAAEARDADRAMSAASAARDPEAFIGHVAEEAVFFGGRRVSLGRAAVGVDWMPQLTPGGPLLTWEPDAVEAAASGDLALTRGAWRWLEPGEANPAKAGTGRYFTVWRRSADGLLRVVLDGGDRPLPALPATVTRRPLRGVTSADGTLSAEGGLLLDGEREVGHYARVRRGAALLVDAGLYAPGE